jgi:hypothetical protein
MTKKREKVLRVVLAKRRKRNRDRNEVERE